MKSNLRQSIGHHIGHTARRLKLFFIASCKDNLSFEQYVSLFIIAENPSASINFIAKELEKDKATISREINVLVKRGLCKKQQNSNDRRFVALELTHNGKEILKRTKAYLLKADELIKSVFEPEELSLLFGMLARVRERIKDIEGQLKTSLE